jgi:alpha-glucosidase
MTTTSPVGGAMARRSSNRWWTDAYGYEIYIRSFADSTGDGVGDLEGLRRRLDHFVDLGIDLIWITPFYPSPMADWGYDVADYCDVDPRFGDLAAFDALLAAAHDRAIRVIIDLVPNHTSDAHPWFVDARSGRDADRRDYYMWADPSRTGGPPNNWISYFGGPAWTFDEASGQYYLHMFLPEQPDLNWRNEAVRAEFDAILEFWLARGVDGFRIDVAQALVADAALRSNPQLAPWDPTASRLEQWDSFDHAHDIAQPETLDEVYPRWRAILDAHDALLLGETWVLDASALAEMLRGDGLHAGFWFSPMHMPWDAASIRDAIRRPLEAVSDPTAISWVTSSHDDIRAATRFGGGDRGRARALALATLMASLPGVPFLYQGEELGLTEGELAPEDRLDPMGSETTVSRDGCRTPMPWAPGVAFGFSTTAATWLPDGGRTDADTVAWQRARPDSWLARYRALVALRRSTPELRGPDLSWLDEGHGEVIACARSGPDGARVEVIVNTGDDPVRWPADGAVLFSSTGRTGRVDGAVDLDPDEALVIRTGS